MLRRMRPRSDPVQRRHAADVQQRGGLDERGHLPAAEPRLPERLLHVPGDPLRQHVHDAEHRRSLRRVRQRVQRGERHDRRLQRDRLHLCLRLGLRRLQHGEREYRRLRLPVRIGLGARDGWWVLRAGLPDATQQRRGGELLRLQPARNVQRQPGDRSSELRYGAGGYRRIRCGLRREPEQREPRMQDRRRKRVVHVLGLRRGRHRRGHARHRLRREQRLLLPAKRIPGLELTRRRGTDAESRRAQRLTTNAGTATGCPSRVTAPAKSICTLGTSDHLKPCSSNSKFTGCIAPGGTT